MNRKLICKQDHRIWTDSVSSDSLKISEGDMIYITDFSSSRIITFIKDSKKYTYINDSMRSYLHAYYNNCPEDIRNVEINKILDE